MDETQVVSIFIRTVEAIKSGMLITRESSKDKEFHFQNWFSKRLSDTGVNFDESGRNTYPDFILSRYPEGYEVKGLAYPGRDATYDSNSQVPTGFHNGRSVFYVFGRYPKDAGSEYPVVDLVTCHGDFLNADHDYVHKNKSVKGFGSYGDIMIRDRKMYVVPTPFALASGLNGMRTLILPKGFPYDERLVEVGKLVRREADELVVAYEFDLTTNEIGAEKVANPNAGKEHEFVAYRCKDDPAVEVGMSVETNELPGLEDDGQ